MAKKKKTEALYHIIQEDIKKKIRAMELKENDRIMSETEICNHYNVSRITAIRALNDLAEEGYIKRIPGKGSFVNYHITELHAKKYYSLTEETLRWGMVPTSKHLERRIVRISELENSQEIKDAMLLSGNDEVLFVKRVRFADGNVIAITSSFIPVFNLSKKEREELVESDYHFIDAIDTKIRMVRSMSTRVTELFSIAYLSKEDAVHFNLAANAPIIKMARRTFRNDQVIEYHIRLCEGTKFQYVVELKSIENPRHIV